jgi:hypothetical protein
MGWHRMLLAVFWGFIELGDGVWGESGGIPHLAKNERDVGHPGSVLRVG